MPREPLPIGGLGTIRIDHLGPKRWQAVAYTRDADGIRRRIKASGHTKEKARNKLIEAHTTRKTPSSGTFKASSKLAVVAQAWIDQVSNSQAAEGTKSAYRKAVTRHIIPNIGALTLGELTTSRAQAFIDTITSTAGASTGKTVRGRLAQIMDMCVRDDAIPTNPITSTRPPRIQRAQFTALTPERIQAIREHVTAWGKVRRPGPPRNAPLLLDLLDTLAATGIRPGEALALRWRDVNLDQAYLTVSGTIIRAGGRLQRQGHPKTTTSAREVSLPHFGVLVLKRRFLRAEDKSPDAPVFPSRVGGWLEASNVQRIWSSAREGGFDDVTFRDYRKAVATLIKRAEGMDAAAAQLGHSSPEITRRHYVERDGRVDFAGVVEAALSS